MKHMSRAAYQRARRYFKEGRYRLEPCPRCGREGWCAKELDAEAMEVYDKLFKHKEKP